MLFSKMALFPRASAIGIATNKKKCIFLQIHTNPNVEFETAELQSAISMYEITKENNKKSGRNRYFPLKSSADFMILYAIDLENVT